MQAPIKQEAPLLLEIFGIMFGGIQPQELAQPPDSSALADTTNRQQQPAAR